MRETNYNVIKSGSNGNCVIINDVMIDCGVPFKLIKKYLYDVKVLLLTHTHSDHIKKTTFKSIKKGFPRITTVGNYEIYQKYGVDEISNSGFSFEVGSYEFYPFEGIHDVVVQGYTWQYNDKNIIYATDTCSLDNAPKQKYDYLFLESNHDEKKLEMVRSEMDGYYSPYLSSKRHLSTQQCKEFYYLNRRDRDSTLIELHKSRRFY